MILIIDNNHWISASFSSKPFLIFFSEGRKKLKDYIYEI